MRLLLVGFRYFHNSNNVFERHCIFFIANQAGSCEPRSFKEEMQDEGCLNEIQKEIHALEDNGSRTMEKPPPENKALGSR